MNFAVAAFLAVAAAYNFAKSRMVSAVVLSAAMIVLLLVLNIILIIMRKKNAKAEAELLGFSDENGTVCTGLLDAMQLPAFIITKTCRLCWSNEEFNKICEDNRLKGGTVAGGIYKKYLEGRLDSREAVSEKLNIGTRTYRMYASNVFASKELCGDGNIAVCVYLVDISGVESLMKAYRSRRIVIGEILIDNYDEIFQTNGETVCNQVLVAVNEVFGQWLKDKNAVVKRLVRERYIFITDEACLEQIEGERFHVLESVKKISVGNTIPVTLSIAISTNSKELSDEAFENLIDEKTDTDIFTKAFRDTIPEHYNRVEQLLNLSLSRGGDQAVVQIGNAPKDSMFFGGSDIETERDDMVEVRVNAEILKNSVLSAERVLVMGHAGADLDALGASLAVYRIAAALGKEAYVVLEAPNAQINVMYNALRSTGNYENVFIKKSEGLNIMNSATLTVLVDTFSANQSEAPEIIKRAEKIIVIDHHRRGVEYVNNAILNYAVSEASSASELVIELMRYIFPTEDIMPLIEAETAYGGILVDTKNMYFKTGKRTFAVAAYLRQLGVKPVNVRKYVQPCFEDYIKINDIIRQMELSQVKMTGSIRGVAVAVCELSREDANTVAPIAADKMLEIAGVDCSFVIIKQGSDVSVKARSLGEVNVQLILEHPEIGGGGHLTAAGAYVRNTTAEAVKKTLLEIIRSR